MGIAWEMWGLGGRSWARPAVEKPRRGKSGAQTACAQRAPLWTSPRRALRAPGQRGRLAAQQHARMSVQCPHGFPREKWGWGAGAGAPECGTGPGRGGPRAQTTFWGWNGLPTGAWPACAASAAAVGIHEAAGRAGARVPLVGLSGPSVSGDVGLD